MADAIQEIRYCENCHADMLPVGKLPAIGFKPLVRVFRCFACNRIETDTLWVPQHGERLPPEMVKR
jgi:hypothetical protein